jgi:hypothetical protein
MKRWSFTENPFLNSSKKSYSVAVKISTYHYSQLEKHTSDPFFSALHGTYKPLHKELEKRHGEWKSQSGVQKGSTLSKDQLLETLNDSKAGDWELSVRIVFRENTSEYLALFPKGFAPFKRGKIENRIGAVKAFYTTLQQYPQLSALAEEVSAFYNQLIDTRMEQLGNKGETNVYSTTVEKAVHDAMIQMYGNLGALMEHFKESPEDIHDFFDVQTLRRN